jgi:branched-chain amino acid transport system permease protein
MMSFLQILIDAISLGSLYALVALGIGLLFGILRLINFAQGDFVTLGAYALLVPSTNVVAVVFIGGWPLVPLVLTVCLIVVAIVLLCDFAVFRNLRQASPTTLLIASFALSYVIQNLILMIYGARPKSVDLWSGLTKVISIAGMRVPILQLVLVAVTSVLLIALVLFLQKTRYGIQMRAASEDFVMARYLGIKADFVIGMAFAISGILAAAVALLVVAQSGIVSPIMGVNLVIFGFIATVIGGMGSLSGSVIGGMAVGVSSTFMQAYLPPDARAFRDAFVFALVILFLLLRPSGIVKVKALEERV